MRWKSHVRFGRRPGETEQAKPCHRAPSRPHLGTAAVDEVRRRVQQETLGHRGRSGDPLYGIRNVLRCAVERLTDKQQARLAAAIAADERHDAVHVAWQCAQRVRAAYAHPDPAAGRQLAEQVVDGFPSCPSPWRSGRHRSPGPDAEAAEDAFRSSFGADDAPTATPRP